MANYRLNRRFSADLRVQRLISAKDVGLLEAQVEQDGDPTVYRTRAMSGLNGMKAQVGLAYSFVQATRFKLIE